MALKKLSSFGNYNTDEEKARLLPLISPEELAAALGAVKIGEAPNFTDRLIRGDVELAPVSVESKIQQEIFDVVSEIISQITENKKAVLKVDEILSLEGAVIKRRKLLEEIGKKISLHLGQKKLFKYNFNQETNEITIVAATNKDIAYLIKIQYNDTESIRNLSNEICNGLKQKNDFYLFNKLPFIPTNNEIGNVKNFPEKKPN